LADTVRQPTYTAGQVAELLNVPLRVVQSRSSRATHTAADLKSMRMQLRRFPPPLGLRRQVFLSLKGGTGKTSLSTSYAFRLAEMGYRVLLLDLDSQGHATKCLGYDCCTFNQTLMDVLVRRVPLEQVIWQTEMPGLDFVPSNLSMASVDIAMMPLAGREWRMRNALKGLEARYDFVVLDAPPSFGLLNLNAVLAADDLIAPALPDALSVHGFKMLLETLVSVEVDYQHHPSNVFVVLNAYNASFRLAWESLETLQSTYAEHLLATVVRQCSSFSQASSAGVPISLFDRDSRGAEDVNAFVHEVLLRLRTPTATRPPLRLAAVG
jgi:chromosome partitioning protein